METYLLSCIVKLDHNHQRRTIDHPKLKKKELRMLEEERGSRTRRYPTFTGSVWIEEESIKEKLLNSRMRNYPINRFKLFIGGCKTYRPQIFYYVPLVRNIHYPELEIHLSDPVTKATANSLL
ncbi:hypothetical protein HAX54_041491 [Datura stramonium]|uniref:Uncharacterized protein n=1 Tax=Datura stramonium TaxID=4076 RepID=A0ABS8VRE8_DATST|nr:hypothetical protein [Datura stramonium]